VIVDDSRAPVHRQTGDFGLRMCSWSAVDFRTGPSRVARAPTPSRT
jgi:hypothetical protein